MLHELLSEDLATEVVAVVAVFACQGSYEDLNINWKSRKHLSRFGMSGKISSSRAIPEFNIGHLSNSLKSLSDFRY